MNTISFGDGNAGFQVGISHGPIYLPEERQEPRPEPFSTVPFPNDPHFVNRNALLDRIHQGASSPGSRIVLVGLGGVGKTRLAIEYCHQARQQSTNTWIFWIHASNATRCEKSIRDLADRARIPGRQDRNVNIFQLVGNWLQDEKLGKWILVLDNVDDNELLRQPSAIDMESQAYAQIRNSTQPSLRFLLESSAGSIIITSRNKRVALDVTSHHRNIIDVQPMNMDEALVLLQNKLDLHSESADMVQLVEELGFMPLAIVQAANYIIHRSPRFSVSKYLERLRKSERQATRLLHYEISYIDRDWEAKNSIVLTWQISFDHIRQVRQSATDLLSLMSFFDWQGIPEDLIRIPCRGSGKHKKLSSPEEVANSSGEEDIDSSSEFDLDHDFEDDLAILRDYSFVYCIEDGTVFTMHRLVQLIVRAWLTGQGQLEEWKKQFVTKLCQKFPNVEYDNWPKCRQLFPHVKSAISQLPECQDSQREWARLLYRGAQYATEIGSVLDARDMASKSSEQRKKILGPNSEEALQSKSLLAIAIWLEGRSKDAEKIFVQVLEAGREYLSEDHLLTLATMGNLAVLLRARGCWEEATILELQVLESRKKNLGEDHPDTLITMSNLALSYGKQGQWDNAEKLQVQVFENSKTKLGQDHPVTAKNMGNLAVTYNNQGQWEEAKKLQELVFDITKTKLGKDHPDTLTSMRNLASTYKDLGRWEDATSLELQVLESTKNRLSEDHPDMILTMRNLAVSYDSQGRWEEAEKLQIKVLESSKIKLGETHPDTLASMNNLASTLLKQGRWREAEKFFGHVLENHKIKLGEDHPNTLIVMGNLAMTYLNQGRWHDAEKLQAQVLETSKAKFGEDYPDTLTSMNNLASTLLKQGRWKEAQKFFMLVMDTRKTKLGEDHPDTLASINNLAVSYTNEGQWEKAERLQVQVMNICNSKLGEDHPNTLTSIANLASTLWNRGRQEEAESLQLKVLETRKARLGEDHPDTIASMKNLAMTYIYQGLWQEAENLLVGCRL